MPVRRTYDLTGTIQGVGFRPTLFRLAAEFGVGGTVQNRTDAVQLVLDGTPEAVEAFLAALPENLPPRASLQGVRLVHDVDIDAPSMHASFAIIDSDNTGERDVQIPADLVMCEACRAEINDPQAPRYRYPFTTCTDCGPRYTVVSAMPYDRERTTLAAFPLCPYCRGQYEDPTDRRFHAETIACPACGPQPALHDADGNVMPGDPLANARRLIAAGQIVAVRGVGGYLLAADPFNRETLAQLRARKHRPDKPFALMAADLDTVRERCHLSDTEATALTSAAGPIVILDVLSEPVTHPSLPMDLLSPDSQTLGVMLPTSPLHALLMTPGPGDTIPAFPLMLMTSGNRGGEPIATGNAEAMARLHGIADAWLSHDREINLRSDDSLCIEQPTGLQVWRRARGYAPQPVFLPCELTTPVLAMGAELKNTIAMGFGNRAVLSPHIGDLETPEAIAGLEQVSRLFPQFLAREPRRVAVDLHPDMQSTRLGERLAAAAGISLVRVQHHHAHALACLAEHGRTEGLALVFDGTGFGPDGTIWGAELLDVTPAGYRRLATFAPVPLPGGDAAVQDPRRQLLARWIADGVPITPALAASLGIDEESATVWQQQIARGINSPLTHAAGRVFDAVAAALKVSPARVTYEGQAAIRLEACARQADGTNLPPCPFDAVERDNRLEIDWAPLFRQLTTAPPAAAERPAMALAFHRSLALAAARMVDYAFGESQCRVVALSGGVMMNRLLDRFIPGALEEIGATVLVHRHVPPNDGGVALGQVVACGGEGSCV